MSDHTPGPWEVSGSWDGRRTVAMMRSPDRTVNIQAREDALPHGYHATDANARLIAKAWLLPELVEALRMLLRTNGTPRYDDEIHADKTARDALARYDEEPGT